MRKQTVNVAILSAAAIILFGAVGCSSQSDSTHTSTSAATTASGVSGLPGAQTLSPGAAAKATCEILRRTPKNIAKGYNSPWVLGLTQAQDYAASAAQRDSRFQQLASDLATLQAAEPPGTQLPPEPVSTADLAKYWSAYDPLIVDCAPLKISLPTVESENK